MRALHLVIVFTFVLGCGADVQEPENCDAELVKCTTSEGAPGWCIDKYESVNPDRGPVCVACDDRYVLVPDLELCSPGCAIPGGVFSEEQCQGPLGSGGCSKACCPICY